MILKNRDNFKILNLLLILVLILIIFFVLAVSYLFLFNTKKLTGMVYDCETTEPISDAKIALTHTNWGFRNGHLVWDKVYPVITCSKENGMYELNYKFGTAIKTTKEGYLDSYTYSYPGEKDIGMIKKTEENQYEAGSEGCDL